MNYCSTGIKNMYDMINKELDKFYYQTKCGTPKIYESVKQFEGSIKRIRTLVELLEDEELSKYRKISNSIIDKEIERMCGDDFFNNITGFKVY